VTRRADASPKRIPCPEDRRTALDAESIACSILDNLQFVQGRLPEDATTHDWYLALAHAVRDRMLRRWSATQQTLMRRDVRVVAYLSAEFLLGPHLGNNLVNLGILEPARQAVARLGLDLDELLAEEEEPGLGNGGLGRLAACFLDSLATLEVPAIGYGIRYEFGIFDQEIRGGEQVEVTDKWLRGGNPWEIARPEITFEVKFGGRTKAWTDARGRRRYRWVPDRVVQGTAYDTPILGYRVNTVNMLRLWKAEACESFDFQAFNVGEYWRAVEQKVVSENLSKVLYPNDEPAQGKRLRLEQQYFLVSCSLQDLIRLHGLAGNTLDNLHYLIAAQLNDTHPALAVPELMRLLVDEQGLEWEPAWEITSHAFGYTNHTLLPEALETWPLPLFASVLPRHLEIVYEINRRFLQRVRAAFPGDEDRVARMSVIDEHGQRAVRMAHLATVGARAVNGVAALHTKLLESTVLRDFYALDPGKFHNVTNGVTPRRWVLLSNPGLAALISSRLGPDWAVRPEEELPRLAPLADDPAFRSVWREVKQANKRELAAFIHARTGVVVQPETLFDVQVKRIHEYKRQHLKVLHVLTLYNRLRRDPSAPFAPRTVIFGGKAAPGYFLAKLIIRLIHAVGETVNEDPAINGRLRVVFVPDFNVTVGQRIYPAADLSEQISTAGKEASGTGNMKFAMNGALTIGTLDGANAEIREAVGADNFFLFGLTAEEVAKARAGGYDPMAYYRADAELREALDQIAAGYFSRGDREAFTPIVDSLLGRDEYFVLADYRPYVECQERVAAAFRDPARWDRMSILNVARVGRFSSDRAIHEYCEKIWKVGPIPVALPRG
jgi:starch phosphorylase